MDTSHTGLTAEQKHRYRRDGYVVLERVFAGEECRRFARHVDDLSAGRKHLDGFGQQENYGQRTFNQHLYDPLALQFLIDERLHRPLADCFEDEPEAIQTMHFFAGSEHPLHQDHYYLPDCMSAWIAMVDVDEDNGPLVVQPGSHQGRLVTRSDARRELQPGETYMDQQQGRYFPLVREVFRENGREQARVLVNRGDVVLFHGRLIHGGAPVRRPGTPRHALACHYIPYGSPRTGIATGRASRSTAPAASTTASGTIMDKRSRSGDRPANLGSLAPRLPVCLAARAIDHVWRIVQKLRRGPIDAISDRKSRPGDRQRARDRPRHRACASSMRAVQSGAGRAQRHRRLSRPPTITSSNSVAGFSRCLMPTSYGVTRRMPWQMPCAGSSAYLDILVNNAGGGLERNSMLDSDPGLWIEDVFVNCISAYLVSRALLPVMIESGGGRVINVGSGMGHRPTASGSAYHVGKAGLWMFTRCLAEEVWQHNITVNELIPGPVATVATRLTGDRMQVGGPPPYASSEVIKAPEDVAPLALFLATQPDRGPTAQSFSLTRRPI